MNISAKKHNLIMYGYFVSVVCGLGATATRADAQDAAVPDAAVPAISRSGYIAASTTLAASTTQGAAQPGDENLRNRVTTALHTDPYLNDRHVTVSVKKGSVVLGGFVFSGWQVQDALRTARKAAGNTRVVDDLDIQLGGR
jgi:osmotically-inducible protein OsmY